MQSLLTMLQAQQKLHGVLAQLDHAQARAAALQRTSREASPAKHMSPLKVPSRQAPSLILLPT